MVLGSVSSACLSLKLIRPLEDGHSAEEVDEVFSRSDPPGYAIRREHQGIFGSARGEGIRRVLRRQKTGDPGRKDQPEPHAARRVATGLVVPSHGSSLRTVWRLPANGLPWPIRPRTVPPAEDVARPVPRRVGHRPPELNSVAERKTCM